MVPTGSSYYFVRPSRRVLLIHSLRFFAAIVLLTMKIKINVKIKKNRKIPRAMEVAPRIDVGVFISRRRPRGKVRFRFG